MKLRSKVLSGFIVLALMLSVAGVWSIIEIRSLSTAVQDLLDENYTSIAAAKSMIEALEREDSGVLLLLSGKWEEGRRIVDSADSVFMAGFDIASHNITIADEASYISAIDTKYAAYKAIWARPIVDTDREGNLNWYFGAAHGAFLDVKLAVNELMTLNDKVMFETASSLRAKASRAIMPGIVAILAALVFSVMFSYFVTLFVIRPITRITNGITQFVTKGRSFDLRLETRDELSQLADSIRTLVARAERLSHPQDRRP